MKSGKDTSDEELKSTNDRLYNKLKDFYIRREKDILPKALPKKTIKIYKVKPTKDEFNCLERIKETETYTIAAIQKMLAICSHIEVLSKESVSQRNIDNDIKKSSKMQIMKSILEEIREKNEKVIIFTRIKKVQKILYLAINEWFNIEAAIVNGEESNLDKRTRKISDFRNSKGFNVIILSPEVAGFGITITEANHVIHYSRLWNPAKEDQETDRVYRIGQNKDVTVHYPIITFDKEETKVYDTIEGYVSENIIKHDTALSPEEKLNILLARKKDMLLNFFLAAGSGDIGINEFINLDSNKERTIDSISIDDINKNMINPYEFEAMVAIIYEKLGYKTYLTTKSNDNGVDVIAIKDDIILFIQCKNGKSNVGKDALYEVNFAKDFYNSIFGECKSKCIIVTSSRNISQSLTDNNIEVIGYEELAQLLDVNKIFIDDIRIKDNERYSYEQLLYNFSNQ